MPSKLSVIAGQYSEKGIKEANEDSCAIRVPDEPLLTSKGIVVAIADGVSSSLAGREASESCIRSLVSDYYSTSETWTVRTSCQKVLGAINRWLYGQSQNVHHSKHGMLTTLSAVIIKSTTAHLFHVGDSRIYRLRNGEFERLTRDHHRWAGDQKSFLSRAMGADVNIEIDYRSLDVEPDDLFFLSTDGVHEFVRTQNLIDLITTDYDNPERATKEIVKKALENGSNDNVTCQICRVENLPDLDEEEFYRQLTELPFPPPLEEGMILDGYKIVREIHASTRTQVYLATDQDNGNKVILKTPSVNFEDDPIYIEGFLNEEWAGKRINNPHVLKIKESSRQRKFLYYVTEFIDGMTLREWITDNPLPNIAEVRHILTQIIAGVRAFQRQEMVHQDLKPENIMIDSQGTVKIVDFGSTKIAGIQEITKPIERNQLLGTLDYAAPEYFQGESGTHQSDIYSIAVITYEMLCGKLPYGESLSAKKLKRVRYQPARQINQNIPTWIDGALEKGVLLDPVRRYQTLSEFLFDLTKPNPELARFGGKSIMEKNPVAFWKGLTIFLFISNIFLLYMLSQHMN
ncbi:MAG: bifunctional protein-serine/threonine kinase/phosphatase [Gammaproteobacteria bacterium]|nr:bifunctional protein-serine/threonine kinase/phosphatase [Gammaproteobacteria bacterium]